MHRMVRCSSFARLFLAAGACCAIAIGAQAQTPLSTPQVPVPAAQPAAPAAGVKKASIIHRRHRRHRIRRRLELAGGSGAPSLQAYPGRLGVKIRLIDGKRAWGATRHQLGVAYAPGASDESASGTFQFVVKTDVLRKYLQQLALVVHRQPVDAHPVVEDPNADDPGDKPVPAKIVDGRPGEWLDVDGAVDTIKQAFESDPAANNIQIPVRTRAATLDASKLDGIDSRIGYFVTRFNPGDVGRTETVRKAISIIDGTILEPGQIFSVNGKVGERTAARGFGVGHVFVNGKMEKEVGGGMCQVATTLFNAAMLADMKIVERHQHVRTIPYVDPGRDATVWFGEKDFKFQNDTSTPVYISYVTTYTHAIVSLYGKDVPGQKVKLVNHYRQLSERHFTGLFYRVVYSPDGKATKGKVYYSDYVWTPALDYQR